MNKLNAYIRLMRPANFLITGIAVLLGAFICSSAALTLNVAAACFAAAFAASSGNIINDYFDVGIDRINKPDRPIPAGDVGTNEALSLYSFLIIVSMVLGFTVNIYAFLVVLLSHLLMFFYSSSLKKVPLVGNITVAFMTGLALVFGGIATGSFFCALIPAGFAFFTNLIREIVKDMEDVKGDKELNVVTFPQKYGFGSALNLINILTVLLIILTLVPFILQIYKIEYFIIVMIPVNLIFAFFLKSVNRNSKTENLAKMSSLLKINMLLGIAAIFAGKV